MAEPLGREQLLPSLLDRLIDRTAVREYRKLDGRTDPAGGAASGVSARFYRQAVIQDMEWLLNAVGQGKALDPASWPRAAGSVINFGLPPFVGRVSKGAGALELEDLVRDAIIRFEPRLVPGSLQIALADDAALQGSRTLAFDVAMEIRARPAPLHLRLRTEHDLDNGRVRIDDLGGAG